MKPYLSARKASCFFKMIIALVCVAFVANTVTAQSKTPKPSVTDNYLKALLRFEPWAESVWKDYPAIPGAGYFGDGGSGGNGGIRGTTGIAVAYAVLIREFPKAPERAKRLAHLQATLKFAIETHQSGKADAFATDGKKWGAYPGIGKKDPRIWQSAFWAGAMGFAAALIEKDLDPATIAGVKRVIAAEADLLATIPPPSGYKLDSKGEENAWDTNAPALAAAWMPDDPRAKEWTRTAKQYLANSYAVPADSTSDIKEWVTTQTLFPSFAMENHGFYHPSYQAVAGMSLGDTYAMVKLVNPTLSKELLPFTSHNVEHVWNFMKDIIMDSGEMAFPSGLDWSLHSFEHVSYLAYLSTRFKDPHAQWAEERLSKQILYRQAINGNGAFVGESCPDNFYREAVEAVRIATAYLHHQLAGFPQAKPAPIPNRTINYPDVGLLIHRTNKALVTVSYGSQTMALVYPMKGNNAAQNFITSPNPNTLIGGRGKATMNKYDETLNGFVADLITVNKQGQRSHIFISSDKELTTVIERPVGDTLPADWFLAGIENHPLTGKQRVIYTAAGTRTFGERAGIAPAEIASNWVNVDNWMGYVTAPKATFVYRNAAKYNRNGAAEDNILYHATDTQAPRAVVVLPGFSAAVTAKVAKSAVLKVSGSQINWSFVSPSGGKMVTSIPLQ